MILPEEFLETLNKAWHASGRTLQSLAKESGLTVPTIYRYVTEPSPVPARVVSLMLALNFKVEFDSNPPQASGVKIELSAEQAEALRGLIRASRRHLRGDQISGAIKVAVEQIDKLRAGSALDPMTKRRQ